jgi:hypothetical protein
MFHDTPPQLAYKFFLAEDIKSFILNFIFLSPDSKNLVRTKHFLLTERNTTKMNKKHVDKWGIKQY